jgi:hypothetical protein
VLNPEYRKKSNNTNISLSISNDLQKSSVDQISKLFVNLYYKINSSLTNNSKFLLGTDLLREEIKRDLLRTVALTLEKKFLKIIKSKSLSKRTLDSKIVLFDIIKLSTETFLSKYYGFHFRLEPKTIKNSLYIKTVCNDSNILLMLPLISLINKKSTLFKSTFIPIYNLATNQLLEVLLDNLIIEISNCIMRIIINDFSLVSDIRQSWYKSNFLSMRNTERFKNNLAWQDRIKCYVQRPKNLYNSEYGIWVIRSNGIYYRTIYANRINELLTLNSKALLIINYIEFQDFILSRLDEIIFLASKSTRYFLTSIIGQIIGLIWRGIIEGLKK